MLKPADVKAAIAATYADIPDLVTALGGADRIAVYNGNEDNVYQAIADMPRPGMLVVYQGSYTGSEGGGQLEKHRFLLAVKPDIGTDDADYDNICWILKEGVVTSANLPVRLVDFHPNLLAMDNPDVSRKQFVIAPGAIVEYWELASALPEVYGA